MPFALRLLLLLGLAGLAVPAAAQGTAPAPVGASAQEARPARNALRVEAGGASLGGVGLAYERSVGAGLRVQAGYAPPLLTTDERDGWGRVSPRHFVPLGLSYVRPLPSGVGVDVGLGAVLSLGASSLLIATPRASPEGDEGAFPYRRTVGVRAYGAGTVGLRYEEGRVALRAGVTALPLRLRPEDRAEVPGPHHVFTLRPSLSAGVRF